MAAGKPQAAVTVLMPPGSAPHGDWMAYAISQGMPPGDDVSVEVRCRARAGAAVPCVRHSRQHAPEPELTASSSDRQPGKLAT
jgi:hypothetical protein